MDVQASTDHQTCSAETGSEAGGCIHGYETTITLRLRVEYVPRMVRVVSATCATRDSRAEDSFDKESQPDSTQVALRKRALIQHR